MTDENKPSPRSGRKVSRKIAHTVLDLFVDDLLTEINVRGKDALDRHDINEIARAFKGDAKNRYLPVVQTIAADWMAEAIRDHWEQNRRHPFERILVKRVAHLFPPSESLSDEHALSRRILPGLTVALEQMAGAEFLNQCRAAARGIFRRLRETRGERFTWVDFYGDQSANDLVDDLLAVVAWSFRDHTGRLVWLRQTVNANLAPPEDYAFEGDLVHSWLLGDKALAEMLKALFGDFATRLATDGGRADVQKRYGERGLSALDDLLAALGLR